MLPTKVDEDQFNNFRAKRQAERDAKRTLLAKEFPLLFGTDSKSRSTIGKYVNKPVPTSSLNPITPGKRKTQSTLGMKPMVDENTNSNGTHSVPSRMSTLVPNQKNNRKKSDAFSKAVQSPKKASRQTVAATSNARGSFLNYRSFSSRTNAQAPVAEVEMFGTEKEKDVASEEIPLPQEEVELALMDPLQEQVHDVLDYLLQTNEVDEGTHRRLSSHAFQKDSLRRLSMRASVAAEFPQPPVDQATATTAPSNHNEDAAVDESLEIDDMDVLQALRTYISTLDSVPETQAVEHAPVVRAPVVQQPETLPVPVRTPSRARNGFASPTPNTRVISITSPTGSHFKRPKQLSSPNPIRFPSRSRRESNGVDEEEVQAQSMKTPPPVPVVTKASAPVSPNPMRLADAFRRGSVSGRKSMAATAKAHAASVADDEDVLGLLATMDDVASLPNTNAAASKAERRKSKKQQQRRRSSAASNLPPAFDPTADDDSLVYHGEGEGHSRKSILNSPSLKTMRVSFLTQAPVSHRVSSMAAAIAAATEEVSASMAAPAASDASDASGASVMDLACSSTDALVAALDVVFDSLPVEAMAVADVPNQPPVTVDSSVEETKETPTIPSVTVVEDVPLPQPSIEPISQPPVVPSVPEEAPVSAVESVAAEPASAPVPAPVAAPVPAPIVAPVESVAVPAAAEEMVVFHPRQMIYMEAMKRGVVFAELSKCMHLAGSSKSSSPQVKYMIHVSMLPLPGNPAMYESLHMVLWKRFSEFRQFHQQLIACPGVNVERIPVLPSRQIASFG